MKQLLQAKQVQDDLVLERDVNLMLARRFVDEDAGRVSAQLPLAKVPDEPLARWEALPTYRRIPLTERVWLEMAPGGDLGSDLRAAAEALARYLKSSRHYLAVI